MGNQPSKSSKPVDFSNLMTGARHGFVRGARAVLHSDFNHTGQVDYSDVERNERHNRPGSILLPLLDRGAAPELLDPNDGINDLTPVDVRPAGQGDWQADERVVLQFVHPDDRRRVAGYGETPPEQVLGDNVSEAAVLPLSPSGKRFRMCATTLAGDPRVPSPDDRRSPVNASDRVRPGEVWVRLRHRGRTDQPAKDDLALFQIAPLVLQSNLDPAHRLYVASSHSQNHNFVYDIMEACWKAFGGPETFDREFGHPFPASTPDSCRAAANADEITTSESGGAGQQPQSLLSPNKMYLIDGERYPDPWIQDQMAIGYCSAPGGRAVHVVLNCKRPRILTEFVRQELRDASSRLFVFDGLSATNTAPGTQPDFGGNIAVSPPVEKKTTAEAAGPAGPRVPAHPPTPHGKIILGDCHNQARRIQLNKTKDTGTVHEETRTFLQSQQVQPIVPIDTSWLAAGHVDEITAVVPGAARPKLAMARPDVMITLLDRTRRYSLQQGRTHLHRGRHRHHNRFLNGFINGNSNAIDTFLSFNDETSVEDVLGDHRGVNHQICTDRLDPIEKRLRHCTGLPRGDFLPLPVYFVQSKTYEKVLVEARTPNVVNMQVLKTNDQGTHLLVPRPCGPRLPPNRAETVVRSALEAFGQNPSTVQLPQDENDRKPGFPFWAWRNLESRTLALFFTREMPDGTFITRADRQEIIDVIKQKKDFDSLRSELQQAVSHTEHNILSANGGPNRLLNNERKFTDWHRLFIPEDTVDVVEAYTKSVLEGIGCTVHFVDAWSYHTHGGTTHCATKVLRTPPGAAGTAPDRPPWWRTYPTMAAADTSYTPNRKRR